MSLYIYKKGMQQSEEINKASSCSSKVKRFQPHLLSHRVAFDEKAGHAELSFGSEVRPSVREPAQRSSEVRKYKRIILKDKTIKIGTY